MYGRVYVVCMVSLLNSVLLTMQQADEVAFENPLNQLKNKMRQVNISETLYRVFRSEKIDGVSYLVKFFISKNSNNRIVVEKRYGNHSDTIFDRPVVHSQTLPFADFVVNLTGCIERINVNIGGNNVISIATR